MTAPVGRVAPRPLPRARSSRATEIIAAAREVLATEGPAALTMRRLGEVLGIRAASLYKHLPSKGAVESALLEQALAELGERMHEAIDAAASGASVEALLAVYRRQALAEPNLYRLATSGALDRGALTPGLEEWAGEPFYRATGEPYRAQALWAAAHGAAILEIDGRFLVGSDLDRMWQALARAFTPASPRDQAR
ncbi:MAG: TetR/AcrR family transcriptional regulator [Frankia sp.]